MNNEGSEGGGGQTLLVSKYPKEGGCAQITINHRLYVLRYSEYLDKICHTPYI